MRMKIVPATDRRSVLQCMELRRHCTSASSSSSSLEEASSLLFGATDVSCSLFFVDRLRSRPSPSLCRLLLFLRSDFFLCLLFDLRFLPFGPSSSVSSRWLPETFLELSALSLLSVDFSRLDETCTVRNSSTHTVVIPIPGTEHLNYMYSGTIHSTYRKRQMICNWKESVHSDAFGYDGLVAPSLRKKWSSATDYG